MSSVILTLVLCSAEIPRILKMFDEIDQKWDFAMSVVSTNQDWNYV